MTAYYNEFDPYAAQWLRNLISAGHIAPGDVDERSILDVRPDDLRPYTQCHFFAGIGVWSHALRRAGWADDRPVWTGSCPCQPFSAAGKGGGFDDERHLWPHFHWLISQRRPDVVLGEQVASKDGLAWLDLVQADLEGTGYASGAVDLCAAGVGAPHIRQRLWWCAERLANPIGERGRGGQLGREDAADARLASKTDELEYAPCYGWVERRPEPSGRGAAGGRGDGGMAYSDSARQLEHEECDGQSLARREESARRHDDGGRGGFRGLADADRNGSSAQRGNAGEVRSLSKTQREPELGAALLGRSGCDDRSSPTNGLWRDADWLFCRDGKWRPVEPGTFPLAHGATSRVGRLRTYGNAIVAQAAEEFIRAYFDTER